MFIVQFILLIRSTQRYLRMADPRGVVLSGGPNSVLDKKAPKIHKSILESKIPILAICYGLQAISLQNGRKN